MTKRKKKKKTLAPRAKSSARNELILEIVKSDSSFEVHTFRDGAQTWVGKCIHCNSRMTVSLTGDTRFTVEHINPRIAGGGNNLKNLALACGGCNAEKGVRHDNNVGKSYRSDEVIEKLKQKRLSRWRDL
jgi:5-methylcytosine-specific restriction endonuclease McrA